MMSEIDPLQLDKIMGTYAEIEIWWSGGHRCIYLFEDSQGNYVEWAPRTDANHMEMVEEGLIKAIKQYEFYVAWCPTKGLWEGFCSEYGKAGRPVFHTDKKIAFALAVAEMHIAKQEEFP